MKVLNTIGLLMIVFIISNMQSMEVTTQFPLEQNLINGTVSAQQYLSTLEQSNDTYADELKSLHTAQYINAPNLYSYIENTINTLIQQLSSFWLKGSQPTERLLEKIKNDIRQLIHESYLNLKQYKTTGRAREGRSS